MVEPKIGYDIIVRVCKITDTTCSLFVMIKIQLGVKDPVWDQVYDEVYTQVYDQVRDAL